MRVGRDAVDDRAAGVGVEEAEAQLLELGEDLGAEVDDDAPVQEADGDEAEDEGEGRPQDRGDEDAGAEPDEDGAVRGVGGDEEGQGRRGDGAVGAVADEVDADAGQRDDGDGQEDDGELESEELEAVRAIRPGDPQQPTQRGVTGVGGRRGGVGGHARLGAGWLSGSSGLRAKPSCGTRRGCGR